MALSTTHWNITAIVGYFDDERLDGEDGIVSFWDRSFVTQWNLWA